MVWESTYGVKNIKVSKIDDGIWGVWVNLYISLDHTEYTTGLLTFPTRDARDRAAHYLRVHKANFADVLAYRNLIYPHLC